MTEDQAAQMLDKLDQVNLVGAYMLGALGFLIGLLIIVAFFIGLGGSSK
ncbi:hypothetical protein ACFSR7_36120 [Cohnella sp. GCM10020058]